MLMTVSFRPIRSDDAAFLYEVYASTRTEELAVVDWDEAQKAAFLHMQFAAQHQFYQERYTKTDFLIILRDAAPVGRLYIARWQDEIRIVDIALLPPYRPPVSAPPSCATSWPKPPAPTSPCACM